MVLSQEEVIWIVRILPVVMGIDHVLVLVVLRLSLLEIVHRRILLAVHRRKLHEIRVLRQHAQDARAARTAAASLGRNSQEQGHCKSCIHFIRC